MSASTLPFELLLHVFRCLDARSFFAARRVSRWWHSASLEPVTLGKLLETLPIFPPVGGVRLHPREAQCLAAKASRTLMLDFQASHECSNVGIPGLVPAKTDTHGLPTSIAAAAKKMAVCDGLSLRLLDISTAENVLLAQRPLDQQIGRGLWLQSWPLRNCTIALSSQGHLLALSFNSSVQIYDFSSGSSRCVLNDALVTRGDQHIIGLEFEHRDYLLRVHLSQKGGVVYLGSPPEDESNAEVASFEDWASQRGLQNKFLDSSALTTGVRASENGPMWYSGLQILRTSQDNQVLAAAQKHGGGQSSRYTLLHATFAVDQATCAPRINPGTVMELARLESFLSSLDYNVHRLLSHRDIGLWENMPSAQESNPRFCVTADGEMLLLAEKERKRISPKTSTQLFVYRLPSNDEVAKILKGRKVGGRDSTSSTPASVLAERTEEKAGCADRRGTGMSMVDMFTVPAVPICLGTMTGDVVDAVAEKLADGASAYRFSVRTNEAVQSWRLESF